MNTKKQLALAALLLLPLAGMRAQTWPEAHPEARAGSRWWWLGSAVDRPNLSWSMQEYAAHGIGTLEITPIYGVQGNDANNIPFLSDRWMEMLRFCQKEGERLGIQIDMNCGTGWPFGGPWVPLEESACRAVFVDSIMSLEKAASVQLPPPAKSQKRCRFVLQRAYPAGKDRARVVALYIEYGVMKVKRAAPGGEGWVVDHFDRQAVTHYLQHIEAAFERTHTPYPHTFFNDSYEIHLGNWTPSLLSEFEKRRGYRLEDHLHELIDGDPGIRHDYRETLGDLLLENFTQQWTARAHRHGSLTRNQAHGSPANLIDCYAAVDIPEIEGFGLSDFGIKGLRTDSGMTRKNFSDLSMLKYAPSAAHIMGKTLTSSESMTWLTEHFRTSLSQIKPDMDLMFCAGVNRMLFHGTCYSPKNDPWPGWKFYASIDMSPTNTIWRDAPFLMKYIERCQRFLQWGAPDNDFLVYLPVHDMWREPAGKLLMQFDIHSMEQRAPDFIRAILTIDSLGFDCDYVSDRLLLGTTYDGKRLHTAAGTPYKALVIPGNYMLPDSVRAHLAHLQQQGARIIYGIRSAEMAQAARPEMMKTALGLNMIRRRNDLGHHYFIANLTPNDISGKAALGVDFKTAVWFDPMDGSRYAAETGNGEVVINLRSGQSRILQVFGDDISDPSKAAEPLPKLLCGEPSAVREMDGSWHLSFTESVPATTNTYRLPRLQTWEHLDNTTRTLMGTGIYETTFKLSWKDFAHCNARWQIDLGDVRESARVYINGLEVGCAWAVPFVLTIPDGVLRKGRNTLRIEVTNLPANRIAQLDREGVKWRKFNEINMVDINYKKTTYEGWSLVPSGLNSSVKLLRYDCEQPSMR